MADFTLRVNGATRKVSSVAPDTPLLYDLRQRTGARPKFGCGLAPIRRVTVRCAEYRSGVSGATKTLFASLRSLAM